ncbi:hypothetical protein [Pseudonocardia sp. ICBG1034]|uniref:hypothetical protein n=1 Tax=Pseudonocardia sp. ICBG1034 TaxID=2844381 RepID=UPI001CCDF807|nr:hypothetical protein [Pseudonocardia sp. ICBG1034]
MSVAVALAVGVGAGVPAAGATVATPAAGESASVLAGNDCCWGWGPEGPRTDQHHGMRYCDNAPLDPSQVQDRR